MALDWTELLRVDSDLPPRLNRAFRSIAIDARAVDSRLDGLEAELGSIALPDVITPGTYGGAPDFVESQTVDAKGRTTAIVLGRPVTTVGSVFSTTGPLGAPAPVISYDFTLFDPSLPAATSLANTNQIADASLDLTATGTSRIQFLQTYSQVPNLVVPVGARVDGGILEASGQANYVLSSKAVAAALLGAMTVEWFGWYLVAPGADDNYLWSIGNGGGGSPANNTITRLYSHRSGGSDGRWISEHEHGAGTLCSATFIDFSSTPIKAATTGWVGPNPIHIGWTRDGSGLQRLYINGRHAGIAVTAAPNALPDGATDAIVNPFFGSFFSTLAGLAFRVFNVELTAAQIKRSYDLSMWGVAA